jgi:hypothetical protein
MGAFTFINDMGNLYFQGIVPAGGTPATHDESIKRVYFCATTSTALAAYDRRCRVTSE